MKTDEIIKNKIPLYVIGINYSGGDFSFIASNMRRKEKSFVIKFTFNKPVSEIKLDGTSLDVSNIFSFITNNHIHIILKDYSINNSYRLLFEVGNDENKYIESLSIISPEFISVELTYNLNFVY